MVLGQRVAAGETLDTQVDIVADGTLGADDCRDVTKAGVAGMPSHGIW